MGVESFRHRFPEGEIKYSQNWYLDEIETENIFTMIENKEISSQKLDELYHDTLNKLNFLGVPDKRHRTGQEEGVYKTLKEVISRLEEARKNYDIIDADTPLQ